MGGVVSLLLGSLMLFRSSADPYLRISWGVLLSMVGISVAFFGVVITLAVRSQLRRPVTGSEGLIGETGEAMLDFTGRGKVFVVGETWDAESAVPVRKGEKLRVERREGMILIVSPVGSGFQPESREGRR